MTTRALASTSPPMGFWSRLRRRFSPRRRLKFTREGRYFFFITLGIGFAAVNTGNNLLYLLLGMTLSLIIASGVLSELTLRKLAVRRQLPSEIFADRPFLVGIDLSNKKRRIPSFSIEIEDLAGGELLEKKCYFLKVPPGRAQHTSYRYAFATRGRHRFDGLRLSTKFPFALFRKSKQVDLENEVVVYPALVDLSDVLAGSHLGYGESSSGRSGRGDDFYGVREFRPGDDPRHIHWRLSAKVGRLILREIEESTRQRVTLYLDNSVHDKASVEALENLERAISRAASLAHHYLERGFRVELVTRTARVQEGAGRTHLRMILYALALLEVVGPDDPVDPLPRKRLRDGILVSSGAPRPGAGN